MFAEGLSATDLGALLIDPTGLPDRPTASSGPYHACKLREGNKR
jgi:hypothetical protein